MDIALEEIDHREVGGRLAVGDGGRLEHQPVAGMRGMDELIDQT
jgi:hypothetical protein